MGPSLGQETVLNKIREAWLWQGSAARIGKLLSLRAYGHTVSRTDGPALRVEWTEDGGSVKWDDGGMTMAEFWALVKDRLSSDEWHIIASYLRLLKPLKAATMELQGNVNTASKRGRPVKGTIWQVLPLFEEILKGFEEARERHRPQPTSQPSQPAPTPRSL